MALHRSSLGLCLPLLAGALALWACDETTFIPGEEDKDGVNEVPSPSDVDPSSGGSAGTGGSGMGGGVNGKPCVNSVDCDDDDACTVEFCDTTGLCVQTKAAEDNNACTTDLCDPATGAVSNVPVVVNDNNPCTYDQCNPTTGASNPFTLPIFAEEFTNNSAGWALGPQWTIGSAAPSNGGLNGGNDPAMNHSQNGDGVAGTALGGLVAQTAGPSYLTSPAIAIANVPGTEFVTLTFWRYLNADDPSEMTAFVEVLNAQTATYSTLWTNTAMVIDHPPLGTGWFEVRLDITAAALASQAVSQPTRVRFGFTKGSATPSIGGWNIDDVVVARSLTAADADLCTLDSCMNNAGAPQASHPPLAVIDDGNDCTDFACVTNVGAQQLPNGDPGCP